MTELTTDDVRAWDLSVIHQLFQAANGLHAEHQKFGESLDNARSRTDWHGEGGDAFREELGKPRKDLDADGHESKAVAAAVQNAESGVKYCKDRLSGIDDWAHQNGWTVTSDWRVDDTNANELGRTHDPQLVQNDLDMLKARAHATDHELGVAVRAAVGDAQVDAQGHEVPQANPPRDVGSQERPGVTDVNDPGVKWQPGFDPKAWKNSWQNPMLADNPPGYNGPAGPARDAAWQNYLAHFPKDQRGFLPNPEAVNDPGLKVVGAGATQLGTSYAWSGGDMKGSGKGDHGYDPKTGKIDPADGAEIYSDYNRVGFDCSGLAQYAANQARPGTDIGGWTGPQVTTPNLKGVEGPLKPGDFVYYGSGDAHHVGIYVAPGVILNAPESGLPVQLDHRTTTPDSDVVRVRRLP